MPGGAHSTPALITGPLETCGATFPFSDVVLLATTRRGLSLHVDVAPTVERGLQATRYVHGELIRSINRKRLVRRPGVVD